MNSGNSKTSDLHKLNLIDKINLNRSDKYVALPIISTKYTWNYIKKLYKSKKFKISAPAWNEEFELPGGSYPVLDIQDYFEYTLKNHEEKNNNLLIRQYVNK